MITKPFQTGPVFVKTTKAGLVPLEWTVGFRLIFMVCHFVFYEKNCYYSGFVIPGYDRDEKKSTLNALMATFYCC
jgi:hypothetical protein